MKRIFKQSCPYIVILAVSLLCALILEFTCFMREKEPVFSGETVSLLHEDAYTATPYGYKKENDLYTPFLNDPQLTFSGVDIKAQTLCIQFKEKMYSNLVLEVYYKKEGELFTSEDALPITNIPLGTDTFCIELPGEQYESIRIDINGTFYLKDVILSSGNVIDTVSITAKPLDALRLITCWLLIALLPLMGMIGHKLFYRKKEHSLLPVEGKTAFQEKLYSLALLTALIGISSIIC